MTMGILGVVAAGLWIIARWDEPLPLRGRMYWLIIAGALAEGGAIRLLTTGKLAGYGPALWIAGGCLLLAGVTDVVIGQAYNFVWWPVLAAGLASLRGVQASMLWPLCLFLLLQFTLFGAMYGRADRYAFCVCALLETGMGAGMYGYLLHMFLSWALLVLVQAVRRNIDKRGNLKRPVPFLPYIAIAFWIVLACQ